MLVLFAVTAVLAQELPGTLCQKDLCVSAPGRVEGNSFSTQAPLNEGHYTWVSDDAGLLVAGTIPGANVALPSALAEFYITTSSREQNDELTIEITPQDDTDLRWRAGMRVKGEVRLLILPGTYDLRIEPLRHKVLSTRVSLVEGRAPPRLALESRPAITGLLVEAGTSTPVTDAIIEDARGFELATSNERGEFWFHVEKYRPVAILVRTDRGGTRRLDLGSTNDLGRIEVFPGETLLIDVLHPYDAREPIAIEAFLHRSAPGGHRALVARAKGATGSPLEITNLSAGQYLLHLKGPGPFQQSVRECEIIPGAANRIRFDLQPRRLVGMVYQGQELLAGVDVEAKDAALWRARVKTDDTGEFAGELWDAETLAFVVTGDTLKTPHFTMVEMASTDPVYVDLRVPAGVIRGAVHDAATGAPLPDASVGIESETNQVSYRQSARSDTDGHFSFAPLGKGTHVLSATAPGYLSTELRVEMETEAEREVDLGLHPGRDVLLQVNHQGVPVAIPLVAIGTDGVGLRPERTMFGDGSGQVRLTLARGAAARVLAGSSASFAWHTIGPEQTERHTLNLPPGNSGLRIRVGTAEGTTEASVFVRYQGALIPYQTWVQLLAARAAVPRTQNGELLIPNLPSGRYEIFVFDPDVDDLTALLFSSATRAPAAVVDLTPSTVANINLTVSRGAGS